MSAGKMTTSRLEKADFILRDEGSIVLLTPHTDAAREWVATNIGEDNGYQPMWPTVVIESRYAQAIIDGVIAEGMVIA